MPSSASYCLHFVCGHYTGRPPEFDFAVTLKPGTKWELSPSGTVYNGKSAHLFCPTCFKALSYTTKMPPTYTFFCGHRETSEECLQMWWALQEAGLVPPGEYKMETACKKCEPEEERIVLARLKSWWNSGKVDGDRRRRPVRLPELARVLVYSQRSRRLRPEKWGEYRWLWSQICARDVEHLDLLRFLDVMAKYWCPEFMLDVGVGVGGEYYALLRKRIEADINSVDNPIIGADKVLYRVGLIRTLWKRLDQILRDMEVRVQSYQKAHSKFTNFLTLGMDLPSKDRDPMFKAGRALQEAACRSWDDSSTVVTAPEAELIKGCVRLDRAMRDIERWADTKTPFKSPDLEAVIHVIAKAREEALRLWIRNISIIYKLVAKSQQERHNNDGH
ncbi:hypothetical protein SUNI508_00627 [Seiridium unicorne]|uniref:Uncharacterized protein n=1 Tax=Seiridium unicorne TaxID=138068 RepID=A0ABR2V793_9PEZI